MNEKQVQIRRDNGQLYGLLFVPDREPVGAVLCCYPLLEERKSAQRVVIEAARAFAADGFCVLTFDYRGCGDSSGDAADVTLGGSVDDACEAAGRLQQEAPDLPLYVLGVRAGALVAMGAASRRADITGVVLWEPVIRGKDYLQRELQRSRVRDMATFGHGSRTDTVASPASDTELDLDGHVLSADLLKALRGAELVAAAGSFHGRVLVLNISHRDVPSPPMCALKEALEAEGRTVDLRAVRLQPFWSLVGYVDGERVIGETRQWLLSTP